MGACGGRAHVAGDAGRSDGGCRDVDGDSVDAAECGGQDCDDSDPTVHPGAPDGWLVERVSAFRGLGRSAPVLVSEDSVFVGFDSGTEPEVLIAERAKGWAAEPVSAGYLQDAGWSPIDDNAHFLVTEADGHLDHVWGQPPDWSADTVDIGEDASLVLDASLTTHVIYANRTEVRHAIDTPDGWVSEALLTWSTPKLDSPCVDVHGIGVDGGGRVHAAATAMAFCAEDEFFTAQPWYFTQQEGTWTREVAPLGGRQAWFRVATDGTPFFFAVSTGVARVAWLEDGGWMADSVEVDPEISQTIDMTSDQGGAFDAAVLRGGRVLHVRREDGEWTEEVIDANRGWNFSIDVSYDVIHVAYQTDDGLYYARAARPNGVDDDCDGLIW